MQYKSYQDAVQFLQSLDTRPKIPFHGTTDTYGRRIQGVGLRRIHALLDLAGHPEKGHPMINVTGTSGKGSVCKMLHCIYYAAGKTVGTYYSPPLTTQIEQIEVNGQLIAPEEFAALVTRAKPLIDTVAQQGWGVPSSFEVLVLIALWYFRDRGCEIVIMESGLGGTYDACNIADVQLAAVVTTVGLDHTEILGSTVEQIARDKVGILRPQSRLFTASKDPAVLSVLERAALEQDAIYFALEETPHVVHADLYGSRFGFGGMTATLHIGGRHQIENACLAYAITNMLAIDRDCIERGLAQVRIAGRSEIISREPLIILDGAHNPDKINALVKFCADQKIIPLNIIFGALADKDVKAMIQLLKPITATLYVTKSLHAPRPAGEPERLIQIATELGVVCEAYQSPVDALDAARNSDRPILITGSMHLVGELREQWFPEELLLHNRNTHGIV